MKFRNDIQGLRAIAFLSVFIFHLNPSWLPGGFLGVDIFFVISGFLISSICLNQLDKKQFSFISFYKSRIKRIVPAYYVLLFFTGIVGYYIYLKGDLYLYFIKTSYFFSLIFQSNHYFSTLDTYFGPTNSENPFLHTWTLAVEMKFYLFLPFILYFIKRKWLPLIVFIITVLLFAYGTKEVLDNNKGEVFYSLLVRTPEFLIGVLASLLYQRWSNFKYIAKNATLISIISWAILFTSFVLFNENSLFPGSLAAIPCLATAFLLCSPPNRIQTILSNKVLFFIGNLSYSLYLWHWPIMAYTRYYYDFQTFDLNLIIIITLATFILSLISYYLVEQPLRKLKSGIFWIVLFLIFILNVASYKFLSDTSKLPNTIDEKYAKLGLLGNGIDSDSVVVVGDTLSNDPKIFLVGDSHAQSMAYYFDLLGKKNHLQIRVLSNNAYPPIKGLSKSEFDHDYLYENYQKRSEYSEIEIEKSDIIILSMFMNYKFKSTVVDLLIKKLRPDQSLIVLADYPFLDKHPYRHNRDYIKNHRKKNQYTVTYPVIQSIVDSLKLHPNTYYLDLSKEKTFADIPFYNDSSMYVDKYHLNSYGEKIYFENTGNEVMNLIDSIYHIQEKRLE